MCVRLRVCVWQYKYLAILKSAHDFTQMEWLMAHSSPTPPFHSHTDACQRPFWRCYINQSNLSISVSLPFSLSIIAIISISFALYLSHCLLYSPPLSQLVCSLSIRPQRLRQFASLLNSYQTAWRRRGLGGPKQREAARRGANSEESAIGTATAAAPQTTLVVLGVKQLLNQRG